MAEFLPPYSKEQLVLSFAPENLPGETLALLTARLDQEPLVFAPGAVLMAQGEPGDGLYFIARGTVEVSIKPFGPGSPFPPARVAGLAAGDVVGEMALVNDEPRAATVTAVDEVIAYRLSLDNWRYVEAFHPGLAARIREIAMERQDRLTRGAGE